MWNPKYDTNELIYETETGSETSRIDMWLPSRVGRGRIRSLGLADTKFYIQDG